MNRDECRTPMAWNNEKNGGFSTGDTTWLSISKEIETINAESSLKNSNSLFHYYRKLISMRSVMEVLTIGKTDSIQVKNQVLSYRRSTDNTSVICYINFSSSLKRIPPNARKEQVIFGELIEKNNKLYLPKKSCLIVKK